MPDDILKSSDSNSNAEPGGHVDPNAQPPVDPAASATPPAEPSGNEPPAEGDKKTQDNAVVPQFRFNEVYGQLKESQRKVAELEQKKSPPVNDTPAAPSEPNWAEYEAQGKTVEQFNADWVDFKVDKKLQASANETATKKAENALADRRTKAGLNFQTKAIAARAAHPDFDAKLQAASNVGIKFSPEINLLISESKEAGELIYHMANNHEDAYKLMTLPPNEALMELGRIKSTLQAGNSQPDANLTKVGNPPDTLNGGAPATAKFKDGDSLDAFSTAFPVSR